MNLRVHGDNILECEHAIRVIEAAISGGKGVQVTRSDSPMWAPKYVLQPQKGNTLGVQCFPGYGRWPFDIQRELRRRGAPLREMADAIITRVRLVNGHLVEEPLMAFEFCGALPAGNQAWQRCGRALNSAYPKIPYFYFAELGGLELDSNRNPKAGRLPNPIIPFAYLALGDALSTVALPVFEPSPSIRDVARDAFACAFGKDDAIALVSSILSGRYNAGGERELRERAVRASAALSSLRRRQDTLDGDEWKQLADQKTGLDKAQWLARRRMNWRKKVTIPVTGTFRKLLSSTQRIAVAIGTEELPICLLPPDRRTELSHMLIDLYGVRVRSDLAQWVLIGQKPLVIVWIAGFKPGGDDSRPDRGLVPLARMIFGEDDVDVLTVVYGPGRNLKQVIDSPAAASSLNGLWEAILRFSNALIIDPPNERLEQVSLMVPERVQAQAAEIDLTPAGADTPNEFGENDVDSLLHLIFGHETACSAFECMCNPPGGDWSGLSFQMNGIVYRWTSLPRVTAEGSKRPDHVVQFSDHDVLLAIESKDRAGSVEVGIGPRLEKYVASLLTFVPTITRDPTTSNWIPAVNPDVIRAQNVISAAAFHYRSGDELIAVEARASTDLVLAFEFDGNTGRTILHVKGDRKLTWLTALFREVAEQLSGRLVVQVH